MSSGAITSMIRCFFVELAKLHDSKERNEAARKVWVRVHKSSHVLDVDLEDLECDDALIELKLARRQEWPEPVLLASERGFMA